MSKLLAPLVLGIESSCDETGVGIVQGRKLLANEIASSVAEHARFGGVVPEVAARAHVDAILPAIERALATAKVKLENEGFMAKAPIEVVQEIRERLTQTSADIESITAQLAALPTK